jgi:hypothetical protein
MIRPASSLAAGRNDEVGDRELFKDLGTPMGLGLPAVKKSGWQVCKSGSAT